MRPTHIESRPYSHYHHFDSIGELVYRVMLVRLLVQVAVVVVLPMMLVQVVEVVV